MSSKSGTLSPFHFRDAAARNLFDDFKISSSRLCLRSMTEDDAPTIFKEFTPEVTRYLTPGPASHIDETLSFIRDAAQKQKAYCNLQLIITDRGSAEFLGLVGLHATSDPGVLELGLWLKLSAHGRHYGLEAAHCLVSWAAENLEYKEILYPVATANIASRKIPESFGATHGEPFFGQRDWAPPFEEVLYRIVHGAQPTAEAREKLLSVCKK